MQRTRAPCRRPKDANQQVQRGRAPNLVADSNGVDVRLRNTVGDSTDGGIRHGSSHAREGVKDVSCTRRGRNSSDPQCLSTTTYSTVSSAAPGISARNQPARRAASSAPCKRCANVQLQTAQDMENSRPSQNGVLADALLAWMIASVSQIQQSLSNWRFVRHERSVSHGNPASETSVTEISRFLVEG